MCIKQILTLGIAAASLLALGAQAQTNSSQANPDLFRLTFRATCRGLNTNGTRLVNTRITESNIIAQCVGTNSGIALSNLNRFFALAYNTTADSIQVVNLTNGQPLCTVLSFGGVASTTDGRERLRLAFMFLPDQTNAFGTATIDERGIRTAAGVTNNFANIVGNAQYVLTGNTELGGSNTLSSTNAMGTATNESNNVLDNTNLTGITTNFSMTSAFDDPSARVCSAVFFTGNRIPLPPVTPAVTNTVTLTNTVTDTNMITVTNIFTNTIPVTNTVTVTNTIPVTNTITVTNIVTSTNGPTGTNGTTTGTNTTAATTP